MLGRVRCPGAGPPVVTIIPMIVPVSLRANHWLEAASSASVSPPLGPAAGGGGLAGSGVWVALTSTWPPRPHWLINRPRQVTTRLQLSRKEDRGRAQSQWLASNSPPCHGSLARHRSFNCPRLFLVSPSCGFMFYF